jgi:hypothetical protein
MLHPHDTMIHILAFRGAGFTAGAVGCTRCAYLCEEPDGGTVGADGGRADCWEAEASETSVSRENITRAFRSLIAEVWTRRGEDEGTEMDAKRRERMEAKNEEQEYVQESTPHSETLMSHVR